MFTDNKYTRWYNAIIEKANKEDRFKGKEIYYESHHITPRSLGGGDDPFNLVLLTAREHFLVHMILVKAVASSENKAKMACAFNRFKEKHPNSHLFERFKAAYGKLVCGENNHAYGKIWCHSIETCEILYIQKDMFEQLDPTVYKKGLPYQRGGHKDTIWINDGASEAMVNKDTTLPDGWHTGRLVTPSNHQMLIMASRRHTAEKDDEHRKKLTGRKRIINHTTGETKSVSIDTLAAYFEQGFTLHDAVVTSLSKRCQIDGIVYDSFASAAKKLGMKTQTLISRLRSNGKRWETWLELSYN